MLLFPNGLCIEECHYTSLCCSRVAKVLYILCITTKCVKQKYPFKKKVQKAPSVRAQKDLQKENLAQNINFF